MASKRRPTEFSIGPVENVPLPEPRRRHKYPFSKLTRVGQSFLVKNCSKARIDSAAKSFMKRHPDIIIRTVLDPEGKGVRVGRVEG